MKEQRWKDAMEDRWKEGRWKERKEEKKGREEGRIVNRDLTSLWLPHTSTWPRRLFGLYNSMVEFCYFGNLD